MSGQTLFSGRGHFPLGRKDLHLSPQVVHAAGLFPEGSIRTGRKCTVVAQVEGLASMTCST